MPELELFLKHINMSISCRLCGEIVHPELAQVAVKDTSHIVCETCTEKHAPNIARLRQILARYQGHYHASKAFRQLVDEMVSSREIYDYTPLAAEAMLHVARVKARD